MQKKTNWASIMSVVAVLAVIVLGFMVANVPSAEEVAALTLAGIVFPEVNATEAPTCDKVDDIYNEIFLEDSKEGVAEGLCLDELETRDFKRDLMDFLNDEGANIEDYKDIDKIVVKDIETSVAGEDGEVELELKVYFFNDGDDDEDDLEKAKLFAIFEIDELDEDEDYEDAEVSLDDLDLVKFYE